MGGNGGRRNRENRRTQLSPALVNLLWGGEGGKIKKIFRWKIKERSPSFGFLAVGKKSEERTDSSGAPQR